MKQNYKKVLEWAVWANLDDKRDLELILLKGHLILEVFIDDLLLRGGLKGYVKSSFARKVHVLERLPEDNLERVKNIKYYLLWLNKIRNKFAHEWNFEISESKINEWSKEVLSTFSGQKFAKYTCRTKVIHAFSALSRELMDIQEQF